MPAFAMVPTMKTAAVFVMTIRTMMIRIWIAPVSVLVIPSLMTVVTVQIRKTITEVWMTVAFVTATTTVWIAPESVMESLSLMIVATV